MEGLTQIFDEATRTWQIKTVKEASQNSITFYTQHGDVFAVSSAVLTLLLFAVSMIPVKGINGRERESRI
ncbi:MAG: hypothetical protein ACREDR_37350, partial [Blastocatellia bacterium]